MSAYTFMPLEQAFDKANNNKFLEHKYSTVPCDIQYRPKRYMYQAIPPPTNSLYDFRNAPVFTPAADQSNYGVWKHTVIFGNYRDARVCPNFNNKS